MKTLWSKIYNEIQVPFDVLTDDEDGIVRAWKNKDGGYCWIEVRPKHGKGMYLKAKQN